MKSDSRHCYSAYDEIQTLERPFINHEDAGHMAAIFYFPAYVLSDGRIFQLKDKSTVEIGSATASKGTAKEAKDANRPKNDRNVQEEIVILHHAPSETYLTNNPRTTSEKNNRFNDRQALKSKHPQEQNKKSPGHTEQNLSASYDAQRNPDYKFVLGFFPKYANSAIQFVKKLSNNWLVIGDNKQRIEIFDIKNNYKQLYQIVIRANFSWPSNVYYLKDADGIDLLAVESNNHRDPNFYIFNLRHEYPEFRILNVQRSFTLRQKIDDELIIYSDGDKLWRPINFTWSNTIKKEGWPKNLSFAMKEPLSELSTKDDGAILNFSLSPCELQDRFDQKGVPDNMKSDTSRSIHAYHEDHANQLHVGHQGFISVWEKIPVKSENERPKKHKK